MILDALYLSFNWRGCVLAPPHTLGTISLSRRPRIVACLVAVAAFSVVAFVAETSGLRRSVLPDECEILLRDIAVGLGHSPARSLRSLPLQRVTVLVGHEAEVWLSWVAECLVCPGIPLGNWTAVVLVLVHRLVPACFNKLLHSFCRSRFNAYGAVIATVFWSNWVFDFLSWHYVLASVHGSQTVKTCEVTNWIGPAALSCQVSRVDAVLEALAQASVGILVSSFIEDQVLVALDVVHRGKRSALTIHVAVFANFD